jgi:hypothetical protein
LAGNSTAFPGAEDVIRFVRFAPWHLSRPGLELDGWIAANVPRGIGPDARHISSCADAAELNTRYVHTLHELGRCRLRRRSASILLAHLVHEGNAAVDWKRSAEADRYTLERQAEDKFLAHRKDAAHAARKLACIFSNRSSLTDWTAAATFIKGMEERPIPDWPADEDGTVPTAMPTPFLHWRPPTSATGNTPRIADYLVALMERLAQESETASPGGYHRRRHGPFYYPAGIAPPRDGNDLLVNGLLYIAVRAARQATGAAAARDVGTPMPTGGRPLFPLAAAYVRDITTAAHPRGLGMELSAVDAGQRLTKMLKRSPGLVCRGWAADRDR